MGKRQPVHKGNLIANISVDGITSVDLIEVMPHSCFVTIQDAKCLLAITGDCPTIPTMGRKH